MSNINNQRIGLFLVMGVGILFAFYAGNYVADEDYTPIVAVIGGLLVTTIVFGLGSSIYLLIPICWGLTGQIFILPLPFDVRELIIILTSGVYISGWISKSNKVKIPFEKIDLWIWINIIYLFITFFRNPVGVAAFGDSARVGGKPYLDVVLGFMVYLMMASFKVTQKSSKNLPFIVLSVSLFNAVAGAIGLFFPNIGIILGRVYSGFSGGMETDFSETLVAGETRFGFLTGFGEVLVLYIISRISPSELIKPGNLKKLIGYIAGFIMIFLSGFRNAFVLTVLESFLSTIFREKVVGILKISFLLLVIVLSGIVFSYTNVKLPLTFQRTLSFLPGNWDSVAVQDAEGSTQWRLEMWKLALSSDKYIHNKILGDGFGYLRSDYEREIDIITGKAQLSEVDAKQEIFLIDGDYHSGPVGSIRFVGVVGLVLFLPLLYYMFLMAVKTIKNAIGTGFEFCAFFYCLPIILSPVVFIFIFGDFRKDLVSTLFNVGIMKMLHRSMKQSDKA